MASIISFIALGESGNSVKISKINFFIIPSLFVVLNYYLGVYFISTNSLGVFAVKKLSLSIFAITASASIYQYFILNSLNLLNNYLTALNSIILTIGYRVFLRELLFHKRQLKAPKCVIYGSGEAGVQFLTASMQGNSHNVICFIDDNKSHVGRIFYGREVFHKDKLKNILKLHDVKLVVIALPSASAQLRKRILDFLLNFSVRVVSVPNLYELQKGISKITQTHDISIEELLGRDVVAPNKTLIRKHINDMTVLVSGAGGSIGSELCRQLKEYNIKKLILLDNSEPSLFSINQQLASDSNFKPIALLGSVTDKDFIEQLFKDHKIDIVFHAAAYKHVPLVEENPYIAFCNNVIGTKIILDQAISSKCRSFTLISTDKAVRPTNLMGASKRLAELLCQSRANTNKTTVSMVRFGNVLGSSGSVIPTFLDQINKGGPVTVTHPDVVRYFMTIPESAQLVLQSSAMASGGEVFLLEMGQPVNILDLAKKMIRHSGHNLRTKKSKEGIEIVFSGLRPGEKLYEELLVDSSAVKTDHPRIYKASEAMLSKDDLDGLIGKSMSYLRLANLDEFKRVLSNSIISYNEKSNNFKLPQDVQNLDEQPKLHTSQTKLPNPSQSSYQFFYGSKVLTNFLHLYFRLIRGLTVGARCIIIDNFSKILLVKHTYTDGWYLPGGGVEINESFDDALVREIAEECGIVLSTTKLLDIKFNVKVSKRDHVAIYFSDDWYFEGERNSGQGEILNTKFYDYKTLPKDIEPLSRECINNWY